VNQKDDKTADHHLTEDYLLIGASSTEVSPKKCRRIPHVQFGESRQKQSVVCLLKSASLTRAVLVTAALLRMLLNANGLVWAAARDGQRWAAQERR
jgi:hypothetical protein